MKRMHVHVSVQDLPQSIGFYSALFDVEPAVDAVILHMEITTGFRKEKVVFTGK
jgi:predicted enzyme related to lactoylglutathione lyase